MIISIKKYLIKVPKSIIIYYSELTNLMLVKGKLNMVLSYVPVKIFIFNKHILYISPFMSEIKSPSVKKNIYVQLQTFNNIKNVFRLTSQYVCKKLKLVGVGYKVFLKKFCNEEVLMLKIGYSHHVYIKIPDNLVVKLLNNNKIFISGSSNLLVSKFAGLIRSCKIPEPYKGKGVLYENERIFLKVGKKV